MNFRLKQSSAHRRWVDPVDRQSTAGPLHNQRLKRRRDLLRQGGHGQNRDSDDFRSQNQQHPAKMIGQPPFGLYKTKGNLYCGEHQIAGRFGCSLAQKDMVAHNP